jgi:alpha-amylase
VTEDEGRTLFAFPNSERLRYLIPFSRPEEVIEALREAAARFDNPVLVFGDDGEKFGSWPETFKHVYTDGWLRKFLKLLRENASWIDVTTPSQVLDSLPPVGRCYLPDASYREMTEWVLPPETQKEFVSLVRQNPDDADWQKLVRFTRGGFWRNFRVRYPETHEMYCRMIDVSSRLAALQKSKDVSAGHRPLLESAQRHLYRGQCNCSYWHGAFGGLYLPHLRNAVFRELIEADTLLERTTRAPGPWVDVETADFNLDARPEIRLANHRMVAWLSPAAGGHLYELDVRATGINLLATLNRRPEPYHQRILDHVARSGQDTAELAAISREVKFKQPNLDRRIVYDKWPRKSLVDLFLEPGLPFERFRAAEGLVGDFATGDYSAALQVETNRVTAEMQRSGSVAGLSGSIRKSVVMTSDRPNEIVVQYEVEGFEQGVPLHLAVELNFAAMPGGANDRYFYDAAGRRLGLLDSLLDLRSTDRLSLVDEWLGVDVAVELSVPAGIWAMPIETISQSEDGFEAVHQSVCVVPHWQFTMPAEGPWTMELRIIVDTSVAAARVLGETGAHRVTDVVTPEVAVRQ